MVYFSPDYSKLTFSCLRGFTPSDASKPIKETHQSLGRGSKSLMGSGPGGPTSAVAKCLRLEPREAGHCWAEPGGWLPCLNFNRARLSKRRVAGEARGGVALIVYSKI